MRLALIAALLLTSTAAAQTQKNGSWSQHNAGYKYWLYTPTQGNSPVVVALHGVGHIGKDPRKWIAAKELTKAHRKAARIVLPMATEQYWNLNKLWKAILAEYEPPPMEAAVREELESFVARRKEEGGAPTDF